MQLTGKKVMNAPPDKVWEKLMDINILAKIMPGVSKLEKVGENSFISTIQIKLGLVNGSFSGNMQLEDILEGEGFTLKVQQKSKIGNANAAVKVNLLPVANNQTQLAFDGNIMLTGIIAGLGQRVVGGVSSTLTQQFFANLEKELLPATPEST